MAYNLIFFLTATLASCLAARYFYMKGEQGGLSQHKAAVGVAMSAFAVLVLGTSTVAVGGVFIVRLLGFN